MTENRPIPFVDLVTPHIELQDELVAAFKTAIRTAAFIGGPPGEGFEREFAETCGAHHCVGVSTGPAAMRFGPTRPRAPPGHIVLTVPHTFIATRKVLCQVGAD